MGLGKWSRYGHGSCEGYALEFGYIVRCDVQPVRLSLIEAETHWKASVNGVSAGEFATFDLAIAEASRRASDNMRQAVEHWETFKLQKRRDGLAEAVGVAKFAGIGNSVWKFNLPSWSFRNPLAIIALFVWLIYGVCGALLGMTATV